MQDPQGERPIQSHLALGLVTQMRNRTKQLHKIAERSGVIAAIFNGKIVPLQYALYLRNLFAAYSEMETALNRERGRPEYKDLVVEQLFRTAALASDLVQIAGHDWEGELPLLPAGEAYAHRVRRAAHSPLLIAHCYTRYLADLNGGQFLRRKLSGVFGPTFQAFAFTAFPNIPVIPEFAQSYRAQLDRSGQNVADWAPIVEEAAIAFSMNIDVSLAVDAIGSRNETKVDTNLATY
jgi:heme oxygenase (biliverdin-producing, ferredoxin)